MTWHDLMLTLGSVMGAFALLPQVWSGFVNQTGAIEPLTSMMNVAIMVAVGITYYDLGLRRSAAAIMVLGVLWGVLLDQNAIYGPRRRAGERAAPSAFGAPPHPASADPPFFFSSTYRFRGPFPRPSPSPEGPFSPGPRPARRRSPCG